MFKNILCTVLGILIGTLLGMALYSNFQLPPKEEKERKFTMMEMTNMASFSFISGASQMRSYLVDNVPLDSFQQEASNHEIELLSLQFKHQIDSICRLAEHLKE